MKKSKKLAKVQRKVKRFSKVKKVIDAERVIAYNKITEQDLDEMAKEASKVILDYTI